MKLAIFGVGGVGGYFGGRLAQAGIDVTFVARGNHLRTIQENGLRIDSTHGDFVLTSVQATDRPADVDVMDTIILTVKAWQLPEAADAIAPMVGAETVIVPLQNGVDAPRQLAEVFGEDRVLGGFCRIVSYIVKPGHIQQAAGAPYIAFGELDNHRSQRVEQLRQTFDQAEGLTVEVPADILAAMWWKFLSISSWSGIGALTRTPVGMWRTIPETRQMWQDALQEVFNVATGHGITLQDNAIDRAIAYVDTLSPDATASMQRDIMAGRPSELASLSGAVVRLGQEAGVETPIHRLIYHSLLPTEHQARNS